MSGLKSALYVSAFCALILAGACGRKRHERRDAAVDPSAAAAEACVGAGSLDGACETSVELRADFDFCPQIAVEVTPLRGSMQQGILVTSRTVDPEGHLFLLEWSAEPDGHFDDESAPVSYYRCESLGRKTLELTVTNERGCESSEQVEVSCIAAP